LNVNEWCLVFWWMPRSLNVNEWCLVFWWMPRSLYVNEWCFVFCWIPRSLYVNEWCFVFWWMPRSLYVENNKLQKNIAWVVVRVPLKSEIVLTYPLYSLFPCGHLTICL
jgi:hypothetical protein